MNNCEMGAYLLLSLSEDANFGNALTELTYLYIAGNFDPENDYVLKQMEKDYAKGKAIMAGLGGGDDDWKKRLGEALYRAITEKKWATVATITAVATLLATKDVLYQVLYHKNP
ncbi:MAG: hypothetical protein A4E25_01608 [Methanobacterium sp. PtaB.Bin024]|nr:MAG: hypothetical protein A4E25_01608 [Methanobacterium sp. PtaB.Bin024]